MTKTSTFVAMRPDFSILGKLLDISMDGLSFQYMSHGAKEMDSSSIEIDIFINGKDFYLRGVHCRIIHDTGFHKDTALPEGLENRRCGLQFCNLTNIHHKMLAEYLTENAIKKAEMKRQS